MNHNGVLTTGEELYEHNYEEYETFGEEGTYRMKLDFRSWWNKGANYGLICYFSDPTDEIRSKRKAFASDISPMGRKNIHPAIRKPPLKRNRTEPCGM